MRVVTFLVLLSRSSSGLGDDHACVPNTQFVQNDRLCHCTDLGRWSDTNCLSMGRRTNCLAGQIIWQGCNQCICQETGQLLCTYTGCYNDATYTGLTLPPIKSSDSKQSDYWCTPFKSYYFNCSICVCPASGKTSEAHCAADHSCQQLSPSSADFVLSVNKNICIPNVMYLFPCLHCLCSDGGYFVVDKCVETCNKLQQTEANRRCLSRTFYRKNCNVCWCPDNSIPDNELCTKVQCNKHSKFHSLEALKTSHTKCLPYRFIKPKCYYCGCNTKGYINENMCLGLECLKFNDFKYNVAKTTCSPGEMVPTCVECLCLRNGTTNKTYCSTTCSYQSKVAVLTTFLKDSVSNKGLVLDLADLQKNSVNEKCEPNSVYLDQGRFCLCPENGVTNFKLCTYIKEEVTTKHPEKIITREMKWDLNQTCKPNSFVEIDCNTCYCGHNGKINPKWCTYDDCKAKKIIQDANKSDRVSMLPKLKTSCVPGSVSKVDCNFCICPESGLTKDQACTKNKCSEIQDEEDDNKFICEPLNYYLVDCNVCLCPRDGIKNVAQCTKKICEKTFLRSDSCISGQFFSNDCNVCVCPPNGDKADRACTNHSCSESETPWKKIFKLSQSLLDNSIAKESSRQLDVCFSGEEFEVGCKICVCSDVGLRSYATCIESRCEELNRVNSTFKATELLPDLNEGGEVGLVRTRRDENCMSFNLTDSKERKECTPGSMYIIRCRQCICPYVGNINHFCRPLPEGTYCEQAFPSFNYIPMGRRTKNVNSTLNAAANGTAPTESSPNELPSNETSPTSYPTHSTHTKYTCGSPGRVMDTCFVCECEEELVLVEEHCFKNEAPSCGDQRPSFLDYENKIVVV